MKLSAEEVLRIAQRIEDNAARFYRKAAELFPQENDFFADLAQMEEGHKEKFQAMENQLESEAMSKKSQDPFGELQGYLETMADTHGGESRSTEADRISGNESLNQIVDQAGELEKHSVQYYLHLQNVVEPESKAIVSEIIEEERRHIAVLAGLSTDLVKRSSEA